MTQVRTTSGMSRLTIAVLMALGSGLFPTIASAAEPDEYPVWWSPAFELESLDKIDERLRRQFWLDDEGGVPMYRIVDGNEIRAEPENCGALERKWADGYEGLGNNNHQLARYFMEFCQGLHKLQEAKSAEISFVRDFVMTAEALDYLPAMVDLSPGCDWLCRQYRANERRISLRRFEAEIDIELKVPSDLRVEGRSENWVFMVEILARADFNGDGLEDLMVMVHAGVTHQGTWGGSGLFLLTRDTTDGVLWVLDADNELCPNYGPCDAHYDEPAALR